MWEMLIWDKQLKLKWIDLRLTNLSTLRQITNIFNRCVYYQPLHHQPNFTHQLCISNLDFKVFKTNLIILFNNKI